MMRKKLFWGIPGAAVVVIAALAIGQFVCAGTKVQVGGPCNVADRPSLAEVDHSALDALLQKYVDDRSLVAYAKWKANAADMQALDQYLARMGCVDLGKPAAKAAQLAYWINVYNALTVRGILREHPTTSIRNHTAKLGGYNIWKDLHIWVDGKNYSLDDIEHQILRKMGEPRIHFAIVSASIGCPPLANRAYTAKDLELWSGCISGAYREDAFLRGFEEAGFHGIEIAKRQKEPWRTVNGIEFRSLTVMAHKGKQGPCLERKQALIYRGPFKKVEDDDGHVFYRGERMAVCDKTFHLLQREPYAGLFEPVEPLKEIPLADAVPFDCRRSARRDPRETKGLDYDATTETSSPCCTPGGACCYWVQHRKRHSTLGNGREIQRFFRRQCLFRCWTQ